MTTTTLAYGSVVDLSGASLHSLASSPTLGWQSAVVDNTAALLLDAHVEVALVFPATAPASSKRAFVYAYAGIETGVYTRPASGSQGTVTVDDITANPTELRLLGTLPYFVSNNDPIAGAFSVAAAFGGVLPPFWGIIIINHTGATTAAAGNTVKYRGITATTS